MEISSLCIIPNNPVEFYKRLEVEEGIRPDAVSYVKGLIFDDMYYDFDLDSFVVGDYVSAVLNANFKTGSNEESEFIMQVVNIDITYVDADDTIDVMIKLA